MKNLDLVILAGGKGSRIKNFLKNNPKPMIKFNNINFLQYLINVYSKYPINNIYILTGYRSNKIFKHFHNKVCNFAKIICIKEKKPLGTGGSLNGLKKKKISDFLLINGDTVFDINIKHFVKSIPKTKLGSLALCPNYKNTNNYKLNSLSLKNNTLSYSNISNLMNGGIYFFKKKFLNLIPNKNCSLEEDILPTLIEKNLITGKIFKDFFIDIGSPKYLKLSSKKLRDHFSRPAAFLDRDGVINYDKKYVFKIKDFKFKKGVLKGLKYLVKKNYYIFIITNQAGIAKGLYNEDDLKRLHLYIKNFLYNKDIYFDDVQYCPYHPKGKVKKYKKKSSLRKPNNQMIKNIYSNWIINKKKSFMIGDKITDKLCANKSKLFFSYAENNFHRQVKKILKSI